MRERLSVREMRADALAIAIEAVACGSALEGHWEMLAAYCDRDGVDSVARQLAGHHGAAGASERWWRCNLLLNGELSVEDALDVIRELFELEAGGEGPAIDADCHALEVSTIVRFLQSHLERVRIGIAASPEHQAANMIVRAARVALRRCSRR